MAIVGGPRDHRGNRRETELTNRLAAAATLIREQLQKFKRTRGQIRRRAAKVLFERKTAAVRRDVLKVAANVASEGVHEFAGGLLLTQKRLGVHANLVREYSACLVIEIRDRVRASEVFRKVPLLPWQKDPIAQKAIRTCEEALNERWKIGDGQPYGGAGKLNRTKPIWASVVQDWEALKATEKIEAGPRERIPESFLRAILSRACSH